MEQRGITQVLPLTIFIFMINKIDLLNQASIKSFDTESDLAIIKNFTRTCIKMLGADFGYVWWKTKDPHRYERIYSHGKLPFDPPHPRRHGTNYMSERKRSPHFVPRVYKHPLKKYNVSAHLKSYVIIPIFFQRQRYGSLVVCFKKSHLFSPEEKILCTTLGNTLAQAITIHRLTFDLKDFKNRFDRTLDSVFIFHRSTFQIEYANMGAVRQLGFSHEELLQKTLFNIQPKINKSQFRKLLIPLIFNRKESLTIETILETKTGENIPVELFLQLSGSPGESQKFLTIVHDLTSYKKAERDSQKLLRQKDEFFNIASHELKTPVTTIKGFAQILSEKIEKEKGDPTTKYFLNKINVQADKLSRLVNDLLDISRLETGKLKVEKSRFELNRLIDRSMEDLKMSIKDHAINFKSDTRFWVHADYEHIERVLVNVVNNASKYSAAGTKIKICLRQKDKNTVAVEVEDFGIGIAEKDRAKIFNRFFQSKSSSGTGPGMGLGLYISRAIIKYHGGNLDFETKTKTKGTIFHFTLPYVRCVKTKKQRG